MKILASVEARDMTVAFKQIENLITNSTANLAGVREALANLSEENKATALINMYKLEEDMETIGSAVGALLESKQLDNIIKGVDDHVEAETTGRED